MKTLVNIRLDKQVKRFIEEDAMKERRSISNFITNGILTYIKDHHGEEPPPPKNMAKNIIAKIVAEVCVRAVAESNNPIMINEFFRSILIMLQKNSMRKDWARREGQCPHK